LDLLGESVAGEVMPSDASALAASGPAAGVAFPGRVGLPMVPKQRSAAEHHSAHDGDASLKTQFPHRQ
jgi:hypothetical protein